MSDIIRDAAIITCAEAAKKAGITPNNFIRRYTGSDSEAAYYQELLMTMELIYEKWSEFSVWDDEYDGRRGEYIWVWSD